MQPIHILVLSLKNTLGIAFQNQTVRASGKAGEGPRCSVKKNQGQVWCTVYECKVYASRCVFLLMKLIEQICFLNVL